ncbi:hypothetical protein BGZ51_008426 [Haplosporangium sp. Z 767]|nr:hypothetical protein BGZ51_008426 [Haplosporangium sp. Z 767]
MSGAILQAGIFPHHDWIPALLKKRIATWSYLMRVFRGGMVLYNTAWISEHEMRLLWNEDKMQRRTIQLFFLGTSIATILEIPNTIDCLKALNSVMQEYEYFVAAEARSKSIFFKAGRKATADGRSFEETGEYTYLEVRSIPFNLDYIITAATLCDMISQAYERLLSMNQSKNPLWNASSVECLQKIDARFKKILTTVFKELETVARDVMVEELNLLDPLGSNASSASQDYGWDL